MSKQLKLRKGEIKKMLKFSFNKNDEFAIFSDKMTQYKNFGKNTYSGKFRIVSMSFSPIRFDNYTPISTLDVSDRSSAKASKSKPKNNLASSTAENYYKPHKRNQYQDMCTASTFYNQSVKEKSIRNALKIEKFNTQKNFNFCKNYLQKTQKITKEPVFRKIPLGNDKQKKPKEPTKHRNLKVASVKVKNLPRLNILKANKKLFSNPAINNKVYRTENISRDISPNSERELIFIKSVYNRKMKK